MEDIEKRIHILASTNLPAVVARTNDSTFKNETFVTPADRYQLAARCQHNVIVTYTTVTWRHYDAVNTDVVDTVVCCSSLFSLRW